MNKAFNIVNNTNIWDKPSYVPVMSLDISTRLEVEPSVNADYIFNSYSDTWDSSLITLSGNYSIAPDTSILTLNTGGRITFNKDIHNLEYGRVTIKESTSGTFNIDNEQSTSFNATTWYRNRRCKSFMEVTSGTSVITNLIYRSIDQERNSYFSVTPNAFTFALQKGYSYDWPGLSLFRSINESDVYGVNYAKYRKQSIKSYWAKAQMATYIFNKYGKSFYPYLANVYYNYNSSAIGINNIRIDDEQLTYVRDLSLNLYKNTYLYLDVDMSTKFNVDILKDPLENILQEPCSININITQGTDYQSEFNINVLQDSSYCTDFVINSNNFKNVNLTNPIDWSKFHNLDKITLEYIPSDKMNLENLSNDNLNLNESQRYLNVYSQVNTTDGSLVDISNVSGFNNYSIQLRTAPSSLFPWKVTFPNETLEVDRFNLGMAYSETENVIDNDWQLPPVLKNTTGSTYARWIIKNGINTYRFPDIDLSTFTGGSNIQVYFEAYDMSLGKIIPPNNEDGGLSLYVELSSKHTASTPVWDFKLDIEELDRLDKCDSTFSIDFHGTDPSNNIFPQETINKLIKFRSVNFQNDAIGNFNWPKDISSNLERFYWYSTVPGFKTFDDALYIPDGSLGTLSIGTFYNVDGTDFSWRTQDSDTFVSTNNYFYNSYNSNSETIYYFNRIHYPTDIRTGFENNHSFGNIVLKQTVDLLNIPLGELLISGKITVYPRSISAYLLKNVYDNYEYFKPRPASTNQHTEDFSKTLALYTANNVLVKGGYSKPKNYIQADPSTVGNDGYFSIPSFVQEASSFNIYNTKGSTTDFQIDASFYTDVSHGYLNIKIEKSSVSQKDMLVVLRPEFNLMGFVDSLAEQYAYPYNFATSLYESWMHKISSSDGHLEFPVIPYGKYSLTVFDISTGGEETIVMADNITINDDTSIVYEINDYKKLPFNSSSFNVILDDNSTLSKYDWTFMSNGARITNNNSLSFYVKDGSNYGQVGYYGTWGGGIYYLGFSDVEYEVSTGTSTINFTINVSENEFVTDELSQDSYGTYIDTESPCHLTYNSPAPNKTMKNRGLYVKDSYNRILYTDSSEGNNYLTFDASTESTSYSNKYLNDSKINVFYNDGGIYGKNGLILYTIDPSRGEIPFRYIPGLGSYYRLYYNYGIENVSKVKIVSSDIQNSAYAAQIAHTLLNQKKDNSDTLKYRWSITST